MDLYIYIYKTAKILFLAVRQMHSEVTCASQQHAKFFFNTLGHCALAIPPHPSPCGINQQPPLLELCPELGHF